MATNEQEALPEPTPIQKISEQMGLKVAKITDTGTHSGMTLRVWVMVVMIAGCATTSPSPFNFISVTLTVALALTLGSRSRTQR